MKQRKDPGKATNGRPGARKNDGRKRTQPEGAIAAVQSHAEAAAAAVRAAPDTAKADVVAAALEAVPDAAKAAIAAGALEAVPDAGKARVATAALQAVPDTAKAGVAAAALEAVPDAKKADVAAAVVQAAPDAAKPEIAAAAVHAAPAANKADVAAAGVRALPESDKAGVTAAMADALPTGEQEALVDRLGGPDQAVTNDIWRWIVKTFAVVLVAATVALVGALFISFWRKVDNTSVQMLLTVFTTAAGILAGFVSGRASTARTRRA